MAWLKGAPWGDMRITRARGTAICCTARTAAAQAYTTATIDDRGTLRVSRSAGPDLVPPREPEQLGFLTPRIAAGGRAAGWLLEFPVAGSLGRAPMKLVIYTAGRVRSFTGVGLPIWRWVFQARGRRVAFEQSAVDGGRGVHFELRDVPSGDLIDKHDPDLGIEPAPAWVTTLRAAP